MRFFKKNCGLFKRAELYQWISTFDPVLFPKKFEKWALLTPPDKAGQQTWRSIILWNMTMMSDYWINVYFVLQYLLCLFLIEYYEIDSKVGWHFLVSEILGKKVYFFKISTYEIGAYFLCKIIYSTLLTGRKIHLLFEEK